MNIAKLIRDVVKKLEELDQAIGGLTSTVNNLFQYIVSFVKELWGITVTDLTDLLTNYPPSTLDSTTSRLDTLESNFNDHIAGAVSPYKHNDSDIKVTFNAIDQSLLQLTQDYIEPHLSTDLNNPGIIKHTTDEVLYNSSSLTDVISSLLTSSTILSSNVNSLDVTSGYNVLVNQVFFYDSTTSQIKPGILKFEYQPGNSTTTVEELKFDYDGVSISLSPTLAHFLLNYDADGTSTFEGYTSGYSVRTYAIYKGYEDTATPTSVYYTISEPYKSETAGMYLFGGVEQPDTGATSGTNPIGQDVISIRSGYEISLTPTRSGTLHYGLYNYTGGNFPGSTGTNDHRVINNVHYLFGVPSEFYLPLMDSYGALTFLGYLHIVMVPYLEKVSTDIYPYRLRMGIFAGVIQNWDMLGSGYATAPARTVILEEEPLYKEIMVGLNEHSSFTHRPYGLTFVDVENDINRVGADVYSFMNAFASLTQKGVSGTQYIYEIQVMYPVTSSFFSKIFFYALTGQIVIDQSTNPWTVSMAWSVEKARYGFMVSKSLNTAINTYLSEFVSRIYPNIAVVNGVGVYVQESGYYVRGVAY